MLAHAFCAAAAWLCVRMAALATFENLARLAMALVPAIFRFDTASSPRSPIDVASWQPFTGDECRIALLLIFLSGLTFTNVLRPVPRAAWLAFSARLPPARGLSWIRVHLLDGTVLLRRQRQRCTSAPIARVCNSLFNRSDHACEGLHAFLRPTRRCLSIPRHT